MQKVSLFTGLISLLLMGCSQGQQKVSQEEPQKNHRMADKPPMPVFPVTEYILGELNTINNTPVTPLETYNDGGQTDSVWLPRENVERVAAPFLNPLIDSAALTAYFDGQSFLDQTIDAVTFTYSKKASAPKEMSFQEINVYVHAENGKVERLYMVKEDDTATLQLTWKSGAWFSIRSLEGAKVQERKVTWNFSD